MQSEIKHGIIHLDRASLRDWPLPMPAFDGDKETRGHLLVIGGSHEMPGASILAATAALRAGAGKLTIATAASVKHMVALAVPEARVIGLAETDAGGIAPHAAATLAGLAGQVDAILIGPGMQDEPAVCAFVAALLPHFGVVKVVLDACAMGVIYCAAPSQQPCAILDPEYAQRRRNFAAGLDARILLTPHAGEMAHLSGLDKQAILDDPGAAAQSAARRWNAVVALKGASTFIATPDGRLWQHDGGNIGLASSGSGDTLAGIISGLAARGASLEQAGAWGVALHAQAGQQLAARLGPLGYLARELADEIPALMHGWGNAATPGH